MSGERTRIRPAAVAGMFYPDTAAAIERALALAFAASVAPADGAPIPKALVVPHAGYRYSGPIAASAYARVAPGRGLVRRVVLAGPSHRVWLRGLGVPGVDAFDTPCGEFPIDVELRATALSRRGVSVNDDAHAREHSLEVQLPFISNVLGGVSVLPIVVGDATTDEVAAVLDACWGGPDTLVVVSTDLSHYHPYATAMSLDSRTTAAIVARDADAVHDDDACGARALRGLLAVASERDLTVEQLDLRNSGDTAGDRDEVVGYGAFALV